MIELLHSPSPAVFGSAAGALQNVSREVASRRIIRDAGAAEPLATLLMVIAGFVVGIDGEINFSLVGTAAGVVSSLFVSLNSIYTAKVLPKVDNDKSLMLYYNNFNASFLFLPLIVLFETEVIANNTDKLVSLFFWTCMTVTGAMGFAIGLVTVMQVKATSPLGHNISGTAKAAVQVQYYYVMQCSALHCSALQQMGRLCIP